MHEASIAQSILNILGVKFKQTPNISSALCVKVIIGEFRNVDSESLSFAFDNLKGLYDGCSGCILEVELIRARAYCSGIRHVYYPTFGNSFRCTECGAGIGQLLSGRELDIVSTTFEAAINKELGDCARISQ